MPARATGPGERPVLLVSDAHLGADSRDVEVRKERLLFQFLEFAGTRAGELYIVGDLFDFWFEYRTAVPRAYYRVLHRLSTLVDSGVRVTYLGGNHDFWLGDFLAREVGLRISQVPVTLAAHSRKLYLAHGDGLLASKDYGYRMLRFVTRARVTRGLFRAVHPDVGIGAAALLSRASRFVTGGSKPGVEPEFIRYVRARMEDGYDGVIVGHHHFPLHVRNDREECIVIGDWIDHFTFVELAGGLLTLRRWVEGGEPETIPPRTDYVVRPASRFFRPRP
jgi:UDP-2,3-diacylglucosamine hydrolase